MSHDEFDLTGWDKPRDLFHAAEPEPERRPAASAFHTTDDSKLFPLYPHQQRAMDMLRDSLRRGKRRPVIQGPCGMGKTILSAHVVVGALAKSKRIAFTVDALGLIDQTVERFVSNGIALGDIGVYQGDHPLRRPSAPIQICSVQTLAARDFPLVDFVIVDECDIGWDIIRRWQVSNPEMIFIGLSATPWARGMAEQWDDLLIPATLQEMIRWGFSSKFTVYASSHPDLKGVEIVGDDYNQAQLSQRMRKPKLVADIVETWLEKSTHKKTFAFCVDRAHAKLVHEKFQEMGVNSGYIDGTLERDDRSPIMKEYRTEKVPVIVSIGTMARGTDEDVHNLIFARPTRSERFYVQAICRALRLGEGKEGGARIFDHSDTTLRLGMVTDIHYDQLRSGKPSKSKSAAPERKLRLPRECPKCTILVPVGERVCGGCGFQMKAISGVITEDGELVEIGSTAKKAKKKTAADWTLAEKIVFYGELKHFGETSGKKPGWAAENYRERMGTYPNDPEVRNASPREPSFETRGWIKHSMIKWRHKQKKNTTEGFMRVERAVRGR